MKILLCALSVSILLCGCRNFALKPEEIKVKQDVCLSWGMTYHTVYEKDSFGGSYPIAVACDEKVK